LQIKIIIVHTIRNNFLDLRGFVTGANQKKEVFMEATIKIVIAEDHRMFREGLKAMLKLKGGFEIIGEAEDGLEAIRLAMRKTPDLLLLDLSMPVWVEFPPSRILKDRSLK
jgi:CheY-like chemotaxis protein